MSPDVLAYLEAVPVLGVCIWLIIRMQSDKSELIKTLIEIEGRCIENMMRIMECYQPKIDQSVVDASIEKRLDELDR